jgi:Zn finger protein HypA/HybF involved in hydrogenase expression
MQRALVYTIRLTMQPSSTQVVSSVQLSAGQLSALNLKYVHVVHQQLSSYTAHNSGQLHMARYHSAPVLCYLSVKP